MAHPLNAFGWGQVRSIDGWKPEYYLARNDDGIVTGMMMVLTKRLHIAGLTIMYAPKGPVWHPSEPETVKALLEKVKADGRKNKTIFIRIDPNLAENVLSHGNDVFVKEGFFHLEQRWSFWNSPRDVYRIDLSKVKDEVELFGTLDRDARRCVRKAEKEGVTIRPAQTLNELRAFYEIFNAFSTDKGFMARRYVYQESLWNEFIAKGNGRLFLAIYRGEIIGGLICLVFAQKCLAMHMGTPYRYQKLQTYYAYVWESMKWAKEKDCIWYSFRGVGTTSTQESFKRKFQPQAVALAGYYDLPLNPVLYRIFYCFEFEVLPRMWRSLMNIRRMYKSLKRKTDTPSC